MGTGTNELFDLEVIALEPAEAMLHEALMNRRRPAISYLRGRAESVPLRDSVLAGVWASTVVHHIQDLRRCANELRRVVVDGAPLMIRNAFQGRTGGVPWLAFFPQAEPLAQTRWPTVESTVDTFTAAGFTFDSLQQIEEITAPDLRSYAEWIRVRDSTLAALSDHEFEIGMQRVERAVRDSQSPGPITTRLDLLVLR